MSTDLVLTRGCRHLHWYTVSQSPIEFCARCGFSLIVSVDNYQISDVLKGLEQQPQSEATFDAAAGQPIRPRSYVYPRLDLASGRQIRILVLKAGEPNDPLQCELEHVNLQQGPTYEAVSYTWADAQGDDALCRTIFCGRGEWLIGITKNCEAALLRLRKHKADRRLWVDAVCIDQSNVQERNHQVKNMIAIFRSAVRVLVFLGQGSSTLRRLVDYVGNDTAGQLPQLSDFLSLFQSRWFHRVWVLQEIAVAKDILVTYGETQMSWNDLVEHSNLVLRLIAAQNVPLILPPVMSYGLQQTALGSRQSHGTSTLIELLNVSRNCACKDARDKVYAVLGLLHSEPRLPLQADYSPSTTAGWVYLQVAAWHVSTTKSLEILSLVDGISVMNMPSWAPEWTRKSPTSLPIQFETRKEISAPQIVSLEGEPLHFTGNLNYPLDCLIRVTGQRCGTIWTDIWIFGGARVDLSRPRRKQSPNRYWPEPPWEHWLHAPSQNVRFKDCDGRLIFWKQVLSAYRNVVPPSDTKDFSEPLKADVPPAFGGTCRNCFDWVKISKKGCFCKSVQTSSGHFDHSELGDFILRLNQHGLNRRLFGTDHSIGLGPKELQDWDEVWILEGSRVPFILRPIGRKYKLVGACYIQAASRKTDSCSTCSYKAVRDSITLQPGKNTDIAPSFETLHPYWDPNTYSYHYTPTGTCAVVIPGSSFPSYPYSYPDPYQNPDNAGKEICLESPLPSKKKAIEIM